MGNGGGGVGQEKKAGGNWGMEGKWGMERRITLFMHCWEKVLLLLLLLSLLTSQMFLNQT